jgi:hypothetical protein
MRATCMLSPPLSPQKTYAAATDGSRAGTADLDAGVPIAKSQKRTRSDDREQSGPDMPTALDRHPAIATSLRLSLKAGGRERD